MDRKTNGFLGAAHDARDELTVELGDSPSAVMTAPPSLRVVPHGPPAEADDGDSGGYAPDNAIYVRRAGGWTLEVIDE